MRHLPLLVLVSACAVRGYAQEPPGSAGAAPPAPAVPAAPAPHAGAVGRPEPLTLVQAHAIALQNHPQIAAAAYQAQAQHQVYLQTRSGLLPQVNAYGDAVHADSDNTRLMAGGINNPSVFSRTAVGASMSQLIIDFGHTTNLVASARFQASAAEQNSLATRELVLLEVDRSYFGALQAQAIESVARQTLDTRQLLLDRVSLLAENKLKSDLDVSFARVALEQGRVLLEKAQNDVDSSLATLSTVLGYREQRNFTLADETAVPVPASAEVQPLIDQALEERPELAGLRDERDAAQRLALSLRDARLPTLSALVAAGTSPSHDVRLPANYSAGGIQLSVPLFAGGLYAARQHEAELRARAAAEALRSEEDNISRDVRVAWLDLNNARERLRTNQQLARYAATAYQLADARYRVGSSSIVELSQAQLDLIAAQIGATTARYEVLTRESELNFAIGATARALAPPAEPRNDPNALP